MKTNQKYTGLEIAIVGMACRFPGAINWRAYWHNLINGVESINFLSDQELADFGIGEKTIQNKNFIRAVTALKDKNLFDSTFFDYRPAEAALMNPVHRIFHECVWEGLEDAGIDPGRNKGLIGLYAGAGDDTYWRLYSKLKNINQEIDDFSLYNLNNREFLAALLSYKLNLKGPSFAINTACSTSLVAVHLACKSLLLGETRVAVAGGVTIKTHQEHGYFYQEGMIYSADGHCRAFDKDASGAVISEGAGVVVLKRLNDALADGDEIYAVIKGSAINNDGNRKVGFSAVSVDGQAECIKKAHRFSKVDPDSIGYVETHGTGTLLGDPIEVEALHMAFGRTPGHSCAIGSVKTNIGHTDTAAGVAGLIKTALSLKYGLLPPSLNFKEPNPEINFAEGRFYVNTELKKWERLTDLPLRAGVSSFGIGGTNAHVILEEPPVIERESSGRNHHLLTLSAKTDNSLIRYMHKLNDFLHENEDVNLADLCYTLQLGRKHFTYRRAIVFEKREELINILSGYTGTSEISRSEERNGQVVFLFSGQGSQYAGMVKDLYLGDALFREEMDKGFSIIKKLTGLNFEKVIFPENIADKTINQTRYAQPLIFLCEYALTRLLMLFGITPKYMIGHSIGEYVAACFAGVFSLEEALQLVIKRGELMNALPAGAMLSIAASQDEILTFLNEDISLAAVNGSQQVVLSGTFQAIDELKELLNKEEIPFVVLHTSHAFHSAMLEPILDDFKKTLQAITFKKPRIQFISNLTGEFITDENACSPDYWCRHMRETVRFADGTRKILAQEQNLVFIEIGAGSSLSTLLKQQNLTRTRAQVVNMVRSFRETDNDIKYLLKGLGQLWAYGVNVDWNVYYQKEKRRKISLPTYSFEALSYPTEVNAYDPELLSGLGVITDTTNAELKDWIYYPLWKQAVLSTGTQQDSARAYLIFSPEAPVMKILAKELINTGNRVIEVKAGDSFRKMADGSYTISPVDPTHFTRLIKEIQQDGIEFDTIIYAWAIHLISSEFSLNEDDVHLNLVYFCLIRLMQALQKSNQLQDKSIAILTNSLYKVTGIENGVYLQSLLIGLVNVIPQEYNIPCVQIDVDLNGDPKDTARQINEEFRTKALQGRIIAFRNGLRWMPEYQKNTTPLEYEAQKIRHAGTYLITGGLGNVGYILARHLIEKYQAKVILTGRREISGNQAADGKKEVQQERFDILKKLSNDVVYISVNIADAVAFEKAITDIENNHGKIAGIIHAAGVLDNKYFELIEDATPAHALEMFAPKLQGIKNIYDVFKTREPDFVWITSSISSLLGGLAFSAYSAANLFLDHFVSSKFPAFKNWRCVGLAEMVFDDNAISGTHQAMIPSEITALFDWSIAVKGNPVILQTAKSLFTRISEVYERRMETSMQNDDYENKHEQLERINFTTPYREAGTATEIKIKQMFENFFGLQMIGIEDDFFELGGDSLKAMILLKRIKKEFNINLALRDFLRDVTIMAISARIDELEWFKGNVEMDNEITI